MSGLRVVDLPFRNGRRPRAFNINRDFTLNLRYHKSLVLDLRSGMDMGSAASSLKIDKVTLYDLGIVKDNKMFIEPLEHHLYGSSTGVLKMVKSWGLEFRDHEVEEMALSDLRQHIIDVFVARLTDESRALIELKKLQVSENISVNPRLKPAFDPSIDTSRMTENDLRSYILNTTDNTNRLEAAIDLVTKYARSKHLQHDSVEELANNLVSSWFAYDTPDRIRFLEAFIADF